jgi:hypothetical protein
MGQGQYAAGRQQLMHVPAAGATGMMMSPGQAVSPQHHMGIPGVRMLRWFLIVLFTTIAPPALTMIATLFLTAVGLMWRAGGHLLFAGLSTGCKSYGKSAAAHADDSAAAGIITLNNRSAIKREHRLTTTGSGL